MKIIYIGDCNGLGTAVAERMKKEEHDIYFLSKLPVDKRGTQYSKYRNYQISMGEDLHALFDSIRPEIVIYAGMSDERERNLPLLISALEQSTQNKVEMFVCLSSTEGYDKQAGLKTEDTPIRPENKEGMWIAELEHMAGLYQKSYGLNIAILRLSQWFADTIQIGATDWLAKLTETVAQENITELKVEEQVFQPVSVNDVADAIKRVVEGKRAEIYNVCSSFPVLKSELVKQIANMLDKELEVTVNEAIDKKTVIDNSKGKKELEWTDFWQLEKMLEERSIKIQRDRRKKIRKEKRKISGKVRRTIENVVLFAIFGGLYIISRDHSLFSNVNWILIYILMISLTYGVRQGAVAVVLSSALHLGLHEENLFEMTNFYSYVEEVLVVVQYILFGVVAGYTSDSLREEINNKKMDMQILQESYDKLQDIHEKNVLVKNEYERRLLDAKTSFPKLYEIINKINALDEERIFMEVLNVVRELLHTDTVCVYRMSQKTSYVRLIASLNEESPITGKSWNLSEFPKIREAIQKGELYEGDVWKKEPALVLPVNSPKGCQAIIVVKDLSMERMSLHTTNLMRTLIAMMSSSMERALNYENVTRKEKYLEDTDILNVEEFEKAVQLAKEKQERKLADYCVLKLNTKPTMQTVYQKAAAMFRQMDVFGTDKEGGLYVLLANTSEQDTEIVLERLRKNEIEAEKIE